MDNLSIDLSVASRLEHYDMHAGNLNADLSGGFELIKVVQEIAVKSGMRWSKIPYTLVMLEVKSVDPPGFEPGLF